MSTIKKVGWIAATAVVCLFSLFGCFRLVPDGSENFGWYIQLNINPPAAAKAISVTEYDVTGLTVEVYDPNAALIQTIEWVPEDGSTSIRIPVTDKGEYEIVVTHSGKANGEVVDAEESANFNIEPMIITVIDITPGCIGMIEIEPGCDDGTSPEDINECAMSAMMAFWGAMGPLYQGSDEFPPGITIDDSDFDEELLGGIIIVTYINYMLPDSDITVNGEIIMEVTFPPELYGDLELILSGSLILGSLPCETVDIDLTLSMFMEDAPDWQTLQWSGTITVNGQEADVDQVMSDWKAMVIEATAPEFVFDGKITFHKKNTITILDGNTANETIIPSEGQVLWMPNWSPDGSKILYVSCISGIWNQWTSNFDIWIMDSDGSNRVKLTTNPSSDWTPRYSPDGTQIAYNSYGSGTDIDIWTMNSDGSGQTELTTFTHDDFGGSWSPDGSEIAYASREGNGIPSIWIMGSDGSNRYQLTTDYGTEEEDWDYWPRWSPDGMRILFSSRRAGKGVFDQWVINNDGTGLQQLTDTNRDDEWGCWSPDGKHILYCSGINDNYNLWMVDSDGSNEKQITFYSDSTYCPCWVD